MIWKSGSTLARKQRAGQIEVLRLRLPLCHISGDMVSMPSFEHYIGIDYSGAETPNASLRGLRAYLARSGETPTEVLPPPSPRKYWSRRELAEWLAEALTSGPPTIAGIDHGFSFPVDYFRKHGIPLDWPSFLEDFCTHWPTDQGHTYVDFVRDGSLGNGAARSGSTKWRRVTEKCAGAAKSVFHFDVQGSVAKSTHSGLPWLRYIRSRAGGKVHFWPFDGWSIPAGKSAVVEVYPAIWKNLFRNDGRDLHQQDAFVAAAWLQDADRTGALAGFLQPPSDPEMRALAEIEGWILGVPMASKDLTRPIAEKRLGVATSLESLLRESLLEFAQTVSATNWYGREREAVSLFAFGFLGPRCRWGSPLTSPTQIGLEVAVPQLQEPGRKELVCKDLVIWPEPAFTCWDESRQPSRRPLAILEWKIGGPEASADDVDWLRRFSSGSETFRGIAVAMVPDGERTTLNASLVVGGKVEPEWLRFEASSPVAVKTNRQRAT